MNFADLHCDVLTSNLNVFEIHEKFLKDASVYACADICFAIWGTEFLGYPQFMIEKYEMLENALAETNITPHLCFEDVHYINQNNIYELIAEKPLYCSLTWNYENSLGGGAFAENVGLSNHGEYVVKQLQENDIFIDTAHLGEKAFYDLEKISQKAIINSHTAFMDVNQHPRNITKQQIQIILNSGGIVGLTLVSDFLTSEKIATVDDYIKHIDWFAQNFGVDSLCMGTDFYGTTHQVENLKNYENLLNVLGKLIKIGYNYNDIEKIFYKNLKKFLFLY